MKNKKQYYFLFKIIRRHILTSDIISLYKGEENMKILKCKKCGAIAQMLVDCKCKDCKITCCGEAIVEVKEKDLKISI